MKSKNMNPYTDTEREVNWVIDLEHELQNNMDANETKQMERWTKHSIYRVQHCDADLNKKAYRPQVVSFGPYHHDEDHLKPMEDHKHRAILHFLRRTKQSLQWIYKSLQTVVQSLKDAYDSLGDEWEKDDERFLKMMILDGCFLIEILRAANPWLPKDYSTNDPIFSNHGKLYFMPFIKRDMLMLENQLPMTVLNILLPDGVVNIKGKKQSINKLVLGFCSIQNKEVGQCLHVLDVVRKRLTLEGPKDSTELKGGANDNNEIVLSAIELDDAGIQFKRSPTRSLRDISFEGGVLSLPEIVIDDTTESTFLNLIAFERSHVGAGNAITSYVCFMDSLVDSGRDITLLHSKKIMWNLMGSNKAAANLFNTMSKDLTIDPDSDLQKVHLKINNYCNQTWHKHRANLIHTYFRSPWTVISVIAAVFLFALTIIQTVYTVLANYK